MEKNNGAGLPEKEIDVEDDDAIRERLIKLTEFEISRETHQAEKPGWTPWAILGSLSAVSWIAIEIAFKSSISWERVAIYFVIATLALSGTKNILILIQPHHAQPQSIRRYTIINSAIGPYRQQIVLLIIRWGVVATLISISSLPINQWARTVAEVVSWLTSFFFLMILGASLLSIPIANSTSRPKYFGTCLLFSALTACILAMTFTLPFLAEKIPVILDDLRLAALLFCSTELLLLLIATHGPVHPLRNTLIDIRRSLALNKIDTALAAKQIEIALVGLTASDILQGEIEAIFGPIRLAESLHKQMTKEAEALLYIFKNHSAPEDIQNNLALIEAGSSSLSVMTKKVEEQLVLASDASKKLSLRLRMIKNPWDQPSPDIIELISRVTSTFDQYRLNDKNELARAKSAWNEIKSITSSWHEATTEELACVRYESSSNSAAT